jgi:hypothetical protein
MRNTVEQRDEEIDERARSIAASLPCDSYECTDRLWCIQRGICKTEQREPCEEYPDNGPTDPWETSGPGATAEEIAAAGRWGRAIWQRVKDKIDG